MQKPKHKEPTNYDHCCSCCPELEKQVKILEETIELLKASRYKPRLKPRL